MGTPSGSVAPSWLPSPPSRRCGSPSRSSMKPVPLLSTANASKQQQQQQPKTTATEATKKNTKNSFVIANFFGQSSINFCYFVSILEFFSIVLDSHCKTPKRLNKERADSVIE